MPSSSYRTTGPGLALFPASRSVSCQADCLPADGKHSLLMHPTAAALLSLHSSSLRSGSPHTGGDGGLWAMQMPCNVLMVSSRTSSQEVILCLTKTKKPKTNPPSHHKKPHTNEIKTKQTQTNNPKNPQSKQVQLLPSTLYANWVLASALLNPEKAQTRSA